MFSDTQSLLEFIELAKKAKIKSFQVGEIKVEFSDLAFLDALESSSFEQKPAEERNTSQTMVDTLPDADDEELLFWSSKQS